MLKRVDPGLMANPELKEAVCESLLNNLYGALSGGSDEGKEVVNNAPSVKYISGFLEPLSIPLNSNMGVDAARNPIHIITQGVDLQVALGQQAQLKLSPSFSIYVRLLPTCDNLTKYRIKLELNNEAKRRRKQLIDEALANFNKDNKTLKKEDVNEFYNRRKVLKKKITDDFLSEQGLKFPEQSEPSASGSYSESEAREGLRVPEGEASLSSDNEVKDKEVEFYAYPDMLSVIPDALVKPIMPTQRWYRIDINDIPPLILDIDASDLDRQKQVEAGNELIRQVITGSLEQWLSSDELQFGGKLWAYPSNRLFTPLEIKNWASTLDVLREDFHSKGNLADFATPNLDIQWEIDLHVNPDDPTIGSVHIAIENKTNEEKSINLEVEESIFLTEVSVSMDKSHHRPIQLDRVKPSYRYNQYLSYPALGFNSGIIAKVEGNNLRLTTTWMPVYRQPRIRPIEMEGVDVRFTVLTSAVGIEQLKALPDQFDTWIKKNRISIKPDLGVSNNEDAIREQEQFTSDLSKWQLESKKIRQGVDLLLVSASAHNENPDSPEALPYRSWIYMNETMERVARKKFDRWHLFQVAFILSQISGIASRMPCYESEYDPSWDEEVALLYFATGGGKTESFFGLLIFNLFLDRLKGKVNGVTAMIRYPLRLLTIQQAQRLMRTLAQAELVRWKHKVAGKPFAIGFWVGSSNTPNQRSGIQESDMPTVKPGKLPDETKALEKPDYVSALENWNKLPQCPFCGETTGLRKYPHRNGLIGHSCFNAQCDWNMQYGGPSKEPLPFYIVDEDIYEQAPSVILGTIDKLALLGQSAGTIRKFVGMFGLAPHIDPATGSLIHRQAPRELNTMTVDRVKPFYNRGQDYFVDPFPSLIIQDEAHLLEESLGTFSGLFETTFEKMLTQLGSHVKMNNIVAKVPGTQLPRLPKIVAASATVSEPERQMEELYQRTVHQFPVPGPDLYTSFYAQPEKSNDASRLNMSDIEFSARTARFYASILTNGRPHTTSTVEILGQFHLLITRWLSGLNSGNPVSIKHMRDLIEEGVAKSTLSNLYVSLIQAASDEELVTLIDLHRIALTYVTNKKGGDQIMAAENETAGRIHEEAGIEFRGICSELISGAVSAGEIEQVIERAEARPEPGEDIQDIMNESLLRSVVATSAISHGVDVDEFNTMFFAGMPSSPSEYIQSSSRIGRTHVGCSILIPTPQRRRDRYILETHDQYHRFLERMIRPAAVNRWAENALKRSLPSLIQAYLIGVEESLRLMDAEDEVKGLELNLERLNDITRLIGEHGTIGFKDLLKTFIFDAIGLNHPLFSPDAKEQFEDIIADELNEKYINNIEDMAKDTDGLRSFFKEVDDKYPKQKMAPMTSLRDVDPAGNINYRKLRRNYPDQSHIRDLMNIIRKGRI